jgi:hypothetical protein
MYDLAILRSLAAVAAALTMSAIVPSAPAVQRAGAADLVLVNGKIITVDGDDRIAQAVAIAGGKIVAVGTDDDIRVRIGPSTERIELAGRAVTQACSTRTRISKAAACNGCSSSMSASLLSSASKMSGARSARRRRSSPPAHGSRAVDGTRGSSMSVV